MHLRHVKHLMLTLLVAFACTQTAHAYLVTFSNASEYSNDNVYVWFQGNADYNVKIPGQTSNITLFTSYKLSDLSTGVNINYIVGGRIYFSLGAPLPDATPTQAQPGVHPGDMGYTNRWDVIELANLNTPADVVDLTSMDQFAMPLKLQLLTNHVVMTGAGTSAGWRNYNDSWIVSQLAPLASPTGANIFTNDNGQFIRVMGANSDLSLYHNTTNDSHSMYAYLDTIRSNQTAHGSLIITGRYDATTVYAYSAAIDTNGNYILTKIGGNTSVTNILLPRVDSRDGGVKIVTLAEAIYEANPRCSLDGGTTNVPNDLYRSICRDLFAALNLGYVDSDHVITAEETTDATLIGKHIYELNTWDMRKLRIAFSKVNSFYNIYAGGIATNSDSYGYAYSDWNENLGKVAVKPNANIGGMVADELNITIYGSQVVTIPEPASGILCLLGIGTLLWVARHFRR